MSIVLLSDEVINQIAAGEVIENPASVVKELVDNAIDARARRIEIEMQFGGQTLIRVEDDGCGMSYEDVSMCLLRHATSKLRTLADLDQLQTMGFRGEALAAIASISKIQIRTSDGCRCTQIVAEAGCIQTVEPSVRNRGTSVEVRSLFFNTPARRKFQKSPQANASQIVRMVQLLALSEPGIAFVLRSPGQVYIDVPSGSWQERIEQVLGPEMGKQGVWINEAQIRGLLGSAQDGRATRQGQRLFLNRRPITSPMISKALREGYGQRMAEGLYPWCVVYLECSPDMFDVNVHPQKKEVRFCDESAVYRQVRQTVQRVFLPLDLPELPASTSFEPMPAHRWDRPCWMASEPTASCGNEPQPLFQHEDRRALTVVGPFLLAERAGKVVVVDLRSSLEEEVKNTAGTQMLLVPILVALTASEAIHAQELIERCTCFGIEAKLVGPSEVGIDALPSWLKDTDASAFFHLTKQDFLDSVSPQDTIRRFSRYRVKTLTLAQAQWLWEKGWGQEVLLEDANLERLFASKYEKN
jgi:DNA mismatch repair protein MutL